MLKKEFLTLYAGLNSLGDFTGAKFAYGVSKNISKMQGEIDAINKAVEPSKAFQEYDAARVALAEKFASQDKDGNIEKTATEYVMTDYAKKKFEKELKVLIKEHKKALDEREKQAQDYTKLLEEEAPAVNFHMIKRSELPEGISVRQLHAIESIIVED